MITYKIQTYKIKIRKSQTHNKTHKINKPYNIQ